MGGQQALTFRGCLVGLAGQEHQVNICVGRAGAIHSCGSKGTVCSEEMAVGGSETAVT